MAVLLLQVALVDEPTFTVPACGGSCIRNLESILLDRGDSHPIGFRATLGTEEL
jgi:hypothetical protein